MRVTFDCGSCIELKETPASIPVSSTASADACNQNPRPYRLDWDETSLRGRTISATQSGDTILVTGRVSARSPARIVAGSTGWIWRVVGGLIVYARVYPSAADAMAAFEGRGA